MKPCTLCVYVYCLEKDLNKHMRNKHIMNRHMSDKKRQYDRNDALYSPIISLLVTGKKPKDWAYCYQKTFH